MPRPPIDEIRQQYQNSFASEAEKSAHFSEIAKRPRVRSLTRKEAKRLILAFEAIAPLVARLRQEIGAGDE